MQMQVRLLIVEWCGVDLFQQSTRIIVDVFDAEFGVAGVADDLRSSVVVVLFDGRYEVLRANRSRDIVNSTEVIVVVGGLIAAN